jgi:hypothetical protein
MSQSAYYVWCPALSAPKKLHESLESARTEARRLCALPENHGKQFFVLRAVESFLYREDLIVRTTYSKKG